MSPFIPVKGEFTNPSFRAALPGFVKGSILTEGMNSLQRIHFRVHQIMAFTNKRLNVRARTDATDELLVAETNGENTITCHKVFTFQIPIPDKTTLEISIVIPKLFGKFEEYAKLELPIQWFPPNSIVRGWYPAKLMDPRKARMVSNGSIKVEIELHRNDEGRVPFDAPYAQLLVQPDSKLHNPADEATQDLQADLTQSINDAIPPVSSPYEDMTNPYN